MWSGANDGAQMVRDYGLFPLLSIKSALNFTFLTNTFYIKLSLKSNAAFHFLLCFTFGHVLVEADD